MAPYPTFILTTLLSAILFSLMSSFSLPIALASAETDHGKHDTTRPAPYPTKNEIRTIFAPFSRGDGAGFFVHVADDVDWTVTGHHPLAGRYTSKQAFMDGTFHRLGRIMKEPIKLILRNVVGGGQEDQAVVELKAVAVCKNGLDFDNQYAWVVRFNAEHKIVQVRAYLDSELVTRALEENEGRD